MPRILITGMSGTGKSSVLCELEALGHRVVDTDDAGWCEWRPYGDFAPGWVWNEDRMAALLDAHTTGLLCVLGCVPNQGRFYERFGAVVLLSAPAEILLERLAKRTTNDYGKQPDERENVLAHLASVEPLLRASATHEIVTTRPLPEVVARLLAIGEGIP
jgi:shikimate kinase